jgi:hypothetical protein
MAAASSHFWKTRLHIPQAAAGCFRGWLFLAWMPEASKQTGHQSGILEPKIFTQQNAGQACHPHSAKKRLASPENLGA